MFQLTLLDHIRLSYGHVVYGYKAHTEIAGRLMRRVWQIRVLELVLLGGGVAAATMAAVRGGGAHAITAAAFAGAALAVFVVSIALSLESRIYAHRWCAARLWLIREKYRALLAELRDGILSVDAVRERRDVLMNELQAIYEHAPIVDRPAYQSARLTLTPGDEGALSDEEIDRFLPQSLRKQEVAKAPTGE